MNEKKAAETVIKAAIFGSSVLREGACEMLARRRMMELRNAGFSVELQNAEALSVWADSLTKPPMRND